MKTYNPLFYKKLRVLTAVGIVAVATVPRGSVAQAVPSKSATGKDYTAADVTFMQGMIGHHAQAVVMGKMAVTHGASANVAMFCKKVIISQRDEIGLETSPKPIKIDDEQSYLMNVCNLFKIQFYFLLRFNHYNTYSKF